MILTTTLLTCGAAQEYFVTPTPPPNPNCPSDKPCQTLDYYATNTTLLSNKNNVSLIFLEGNHQTSFFDVANSTTMTVAGNNKEKVNILCSIFSLENVSNLTVKNLSFNNCYITFGSGHGLSSNNSAMLFSELIFQNSSIWIQKLEVSDPYTVTVVNLTDIQANVDGSNENQFNINTNQMIFTLLRCAFRQPLKILIPQTQVRALTIRDSAFEDNNGFAALYFEGNFEVYAYTITMITLDNVTFCRNGFTAITVDRPVDMVIQNCVFVNNSGIVGGAISATNSRLSFSGDNLFLNNTGRNGGAIHLLNSTILLEKNLNISFKDNKAEQIGGAIFVESGCEQGNCFFSLTFDHTFLSSIPVSINFENNTATSGNDIYGAGLMNYCDVTPDKTTKSCQIQSIFTFSPHTLTSVTTSPRRVCLCKNNVPNCADIDYIFHATSVAAGEKFTLSAALVGENFGTIAGGVYASSVKSEPNFTFGANNQLQLLKSNKECSVLEYSIEPKNEKIKEVSFILSTDIITASRHQLDLNNPREVHSDLKKAINEYHATKCIIDTLQNAPVVINVTIIPCPRGLRLSNKHICECESSLNNYITNCSTKNNIGLFHRNKNVWIGPTDTNNNSNSSVISVYSSCPFDYCNYNALDVELTNPDSQCALNHSGVLCGGCAEGLSLALGSHRCMDCSNNGNIAWLLLFIVGGIVLVLFIKILDLTVSQGTINGLIFYANVVWINQGIFFPNLNGHNNEFLSKLFVIMKGFIAWLNLDFGIEICFFDGFDAYWKTWLQFAYTFYMLFLAGLIVLVCRYSVRATRLLGNNPVSVLCTIILLSYVKLLRTIVDSLNMAMLTQFNPSGTKWVWLLDGNVPYLGLKHAFLFAAAVLVLLFLWLPYTFALLFVRHLHKLPCGLSRFTVRLIPFLDSYTGPLKTKYQYWVGLSLLTRVGLALIVLVSQAIGPSLNIALLCTTASIFCAFVINIYKKVYVTFLEVIFLLNVVCLCIAFLTFDTIEAKTMSVCISSSVCLTIFIGILSFHIYRTVKKLFIFCFQKKGYQDLDATSLDVDPNKNKEQIEGPTHSSNEFLREELLSSSY